MLREDEEIISILNNVRYLYLRDLSEPIDNSLLITVDEAIVDRSAAAVRDAAGVLPEIARDAAPIRTTETCMTFELHWRRCAAYLVTEELVGSGGSYDDEIFTGRVLRTYTKSHFLDHLARDTGGHIEPILHYKLVCLNHLIDVASYAAPEVRLLRRGSGQLSSRMKPN